MIDVYREPLSRLADPLGRALTAVRVSPHALSMSGIVCISAYLLLSDMWVLAVGFFALSGLSGVVGGLVARTRPAVFVRILISPVGRGPISRQADCSVHMRFSLGTARKESGGCR